MTDLATFDLNNTYGRFLDLLTAEHVIREPCPDFPEKGLLLVKKGSPRLYPWYSSETVGTLSPRGAWSWSLDIDDGDWEPLKFCTSMENTQWALDIFLQARHKEYRSTRLTTDYDASAQPRFKWSARYDGLASYSERIEFAILKCMLEWHKRYLNIRGREQKVR